MHSIDSNVLKNQSHFISEINSGPNHDIQGNFSHPNSDFTWHTLYGSIENNFFTLVSGIESVFLYIAEQVMKQFEQRRESSADVNSNHDSSDSVKLEEEHTNDSATKSKCCKS